MKEKDEYVDEGQIYEVGFHILPSVSEEELQTTVTKLRDTITANDGVIFADEFPKMRDLAYEIKKRVETKYLRYNKAYFGWMKFEMLTSAIGEMKKQFENNKNVLRFIIVKTVRENTMHTPKAPVSRATAPTDEVKIVNQIVPEEKVEVSEADIDKSIDELLVEDIKN
jgi:ribosomal protein S6